MKMKKILYVTTVSSTVNAFLVPHIKMLINDDNIVDCAFNINKPLDEELINLGVNSYNIPFSRRPLGIGNIKAFNEIIRLQRLKKQYIKEFMDIADELNELNDYVDEDMIRINKGKISRKVNIPSLT